MGRIDTRIFQGQSGIVNPIRSIQAAKLEMILWLHRRRWTLTAIVSAHLPPLQVLLPAMDGLFDTNPCVKEVRRSNGTMK